MAESHNPHSYHGHIGELVDQIVSPIAPFSALILTIVIVIIAFIRIYVLDIFLPRIYSKRVFENLNPIQRRSFINHHVAALTKIIVILLGAFPFLALTIGGGTPHTPMAPGSSVTIGDVLIVVSQIFCGMYVFELFYRDQISPISFAHHAGAIIIAQSVIVMTIDWDHTQDAIYEFVLALIWGCFDVLAELWPHIAMLIYRIYPERHASLARMLYACTIIELFGTTLETAIVMWLFGSLWDVWSDSLKVATPLLHLLFTIAQLWGAWVLWNLARTHSRRAAKDGIKPQGGQPMDDEKTAPKNC